MRSLWRRSDHALEPLAGSMDIAPRTDQELCVRVLSQVLDPSDLGGRGIGAMGVVEAAGSEAGEHVGQTVLVPATIPESEERHAPLVPLLQPEFEDATVASHLLCPARWALPLIDGLHLTAPLGAVAARELVDAYTLLIEARIEPRCQTLVIGTGARAELCVQLASARECKITRLSRAEELSADGAHIGSRERLHVVIATDDAALLESSARWLETQQRPSVAVFTRAHEIGVSLRAICAANARVVGVCGGHPDLLPELVAMVVKGDIDLSRAAEARTLDQPLGAGTYAITVSD